MATNLLVNYSHKNENEKKYQKCVCFFWGGSVWRFNSCFCFYYRYKLIKVEPKNKVQQKLIEQFRDVPREDVNIFVFHFSSFLNLYLEIHKVGIISIFIVSSNVNHKLEIVGNQINSNKNFKTDITGNYFHSF